jgi:Tfp pilus assembly protein PilF
MGNYLIPLYGMIGWILTMSAGCAQLPRIVELHDPLSAKEHFQLALAYEQKKENELALREYDEVLKKKEFREETYTNMANIYLSQGKEDLAEAFYLKSIQANPRYGKAYNNLAWLYISENKQLQRAEQLLLNVIEKDPEHSASYLDTLGSVYEKEGRWEKSLDTLKKAATEDFKGDAALETEFLKHLEKVLITLKKKGEADDVRQKINSIEAQHPEEIPPHGH